MPHRQITLFNQRKVLSLIEGSNNIFLIVGKRSFKYNEFFQILNSKYYDKIHLQSIKDIYPTFKTAKIISKKLTKNNFDLIIALGGGAVIDTAKMIKLIYL